MGEHSRIAIVIGTKAELIKCMPLMKELQKRKLDYWFIHTGQHPVSEACDEFRIKRPDFILSKEPKISTKFWSKINKLSALWMIYMVFKIKRLVRKLKPKYIIYHGDTMSTCAASVGSSKFLNGNKRWKNVHLEAGLRSKSLMEPFPEEISRQISDRFSDILLAVSNLSEYNLKKEKQKGQIVKMGNTIIDASIITYNEAKKRYKKKSKNYALINIHRHENIVNEKRLRNIIKILKHIKVDAVWPLHDNTRHFLEKYGLMEEVKSMKNIKITPLVNYFEFMFLLYHCKYLVVDGGSIQEESLVFKKPCVLLRKNTERQEGLSTGINFLTGVNVDSARRAIEHIENNNVKLKKFENPYGKVGLSKKIVDFLV